MGGDPNHLRPSWDDPPSGRQGNISSKTCVIERSSPKISSRDFQEVFVDCRVFKGGVQWEGRCFGGASAEGVS